MKPFTLGWWMYQSDRAGEKAVAAFDRGADARAERYGRLHSWIIRRILRKYGERDA